MTRINGSCQRYYEADDINDKADRSMGCPLHIDGVSSGSICQLGRYVLGWILQTWT